MKLSSLVEAVFANAVLLYLISLVRDDQASRLGYWNSIGFSANPSYSLLTLRYSSLKGATSIPGLSTLDWVQVLIVALVLIDAYFVLDTFQKKNAPDATHRTP